MSEKREPSDWDHLKQKLEFAQLRFQWTIEETVHNVYYRTQTSATQRSELSRSADAFAGEFLGFLSDNLTAKLGPLHPTKEQIRLFYFLLESVSRNELLPKSTEGRIDQAGRPFLIKRYEAGRISGFPDEKYAGLSVNRGLEPSYPHGFYIFGFMGMDMPRTIKFLTFLDKPQITQEVQNILLIPPEKNGFTSQVHLLSKGDRITISTSGVYQNEETVRTDQYHLIGSFYGETTGRDYWLYGSNEDHNKTTVTPRISIRNLIPQRVNNR